MDEIVRFDDGTPSLKPPGNLGTLTCLALSGILSAWAREGAEFLVIANGGDLGFRLDPRILGFMHRRSDVDAVVTAVPWGVRGEVLTGSGPRQVRADASGWCQVDGLGSGRLRYSGRPVPEVLLEDAVLPLISASFDSGGRLCEVATNAGWRTAVIEGTRSNNLNPDDLFSTNQIYLRVSALRRVMGLNDDYDVPSAVAGFVDRQPFQVERKVVTTNDTEVEALQLSQAISGMLQELSLVPVQVSRTASAGQYGGHSTMKTSADVGFAQLLLDDLASKGDQLALA